MIVQKRGEKIVVGFYGKHIIGIDEFNNGFQDRTLPLIYVSHLTRDYNHSSHSNEPYGKKMYGLNRGKDKAFLRRALRFLQHHPDFFYTLIHKDEYSLVIRAQAIASLIARNLTKYPDLKKGNAVVGIDHIDGADSTKFVKETLEGILQESGINIPVRFQVHGDQFNGAIRAADSIAYFLAGLRRRKPEKWPCRYNRIPNDFILDYITKRD